MSLKPVLFSVITPTFNSMKFIKNLIYSLKNQTLGDWECCLVDDGSTDGTADFLEKISAEDKRFRLYQKKPEGNPSRSRNFALRMAKGRYVAFCDHDDFWHPQKLAVQKKTFENFPDLALVHTERIIWKKKTLPDNFPKLEFDEGSLQTNLEKKALYQQMTITNSSLVVPRDLAEKVGYLNENIIAVDDYHFCLKLAQLGRLLKIKLPLTYYYSHGRNLSQKKEIMVEGLKSLTRELKKEKFCPKITRSIERQALKSNAVHLLKSSPFKSVKLLLKSLRLGLDFKTLALFFPVTFFDFKTKNI